MVTKLLGENSNCMRDLQEIVKEGIKYPDRLAALSTFLDVDSSPIPLSRLSFYEHYLGHGMVQRAISWLSQELKDLSSALGEDNNLALLVADTLSSLLVEQGNWKEAEKLQRPTVKAKIRSFGAAHYFTWQSWTVVGKILRDSGQTQIARNLFFPIPGSESIPTRGGELIEIIKMQSLMLTLQAEEDFEMLRKGSELLTFRISRILGDDHLITLKKQENEALILKTEGLWQEAESLERKIWEKKKRVFIKGHPELLLIMSRLSSTLCSQNKREEAEELEVQVMQQRLDVLGIDHPDTLFSMSNLVTILGSFNQWEKAERLNAQVMRATFARLGPNQSKTCASVFNLGKAIAAQGRWSEAWRMMNAAIWAWQIQNPWCKKRPSWFLPDGGADYLRVMCHLADDDNSRLKCIAVIEDQVKSLTKELGENNPRITNVLNTIKELRTNQLTEKIVSANMKRNRQRRPISRGLQSLLDQIATTNLSTQEAVHIELEELEAICMQWNENIINEVNVLRKKSEELVMSAKQAFRRPNGNVAKHVRSKRLGSQCPTPSSARSQSFNKLPG